MTTIHPPDLTVRRCKNTFHSSLWARVKRVLRDYFFLITCRIAEASANQISTLNLLEGNNYDE